MQQQRKKDSLKDEVTGKPIPAPISDEDLQKQDDEQLETITHAFVTAFLIAAGIRLAITAYNWYFSGGN